MEARLLVKIGLRLLAVYMIGLGVRILPTYFSFSYNDIPFNSLGNPAFYLLMATNPAVYGLIIWFLAPYLAKFLVGKDAAGTPTPTDPAAWQITGFTLLGAYFVVDDFPALLGLLVQVFWHGPGSELLIHRNQTLLAGDFVATGGGLLLGIVLILAAGNITRLLRRLRYAGLAPVSKD